MLIKLQGIHPREPRSVPAKSNRHDEKQKTVDALIEDLYDIQTGKASSKIYAELLHEII